MYGTDAATEPPRRTEQEHRPEQDGDEPTTTADATVETAADATQSPPPAAPPKPPRQRSAATRAIQAIAFHAGAIVLFAIPAIVLWWHVWTTHPSTTLTCPCGDPAQQVWFTAWPAYALAHGHNLVFSQWVNTPHGANLLSNTAGTLVATVLAPITWAWGPVTATNVALTLAPALSAWGCFVALRPLLTWKAAAFPAALVYGYSAAIVTSLIFGHVSVTVLVIPPILFTLLYEILIRQQHSATRDGLFLAALLVVQFFISPEILVLCALFGVIGIVPVLVVGWRQLRVRAWHALPALALGVVVSAVLLAYPVWFGLRGPQAVTGVLFLIAPLTGVPLSGVLSPGQYGSFANSFVRLGGYRGRLGPPPDFIGIGAAAAAVAAFVLAWRRLLTWLVAFLAVAAVWLSLGPYQFGESAWLSHLWLPWRELDNLPILKEILPNQITPFIALFVAFLLALGLDALFTLPDRRHGWFDRHRRTVTLVATGAVGVAALLPLFLTYDMPFHVTKIELPPYLPNGLPDRSAEHRAPHHPVRRLGRGPAHAVAGRQRLPLPAGRRRTEDAERPRRACPARRARVRPLDPHQPHRGRPVPADRGRRRAADRAPRPGAMARPARRRRRRQPRPQVRVGLLHRGARHGTRVRARRLGLDAPPRMDHDPAGLRGAARGLPRRGERPGRAGQTALHVDLRALRRRPLPRSDLI